MSHPTNSMQGKVALVTGAAKSLGADIVRCLAQSGAHVIVNYFHSTDRAKLLQAELEQAGHSCEFIRASVAKTSEIERMFDLIEERHGRLDVLVNNAAGGAFLPLFDIDDTYWQRAWSTNVMAAYHCSRRAAELMAGREHASILCLSSVGAHQPVPGYGPGGVTKAALESLVRYLALELVSHGIRVNTVLLGSVASEIVVNLDDPAAALGESAENNELMRRTLSTPEAARLIVHLLHEDTGFITGQTIVADGGIGIGGMQGVSLHSKLADRVSVARRGPIPRAAVATSPEASWHVPTSALATDAAPKSAPAQLTSPAPRQAAVPPPNPESAAKPTPNPEPMPDSGAVAVVGLGLALPGANNADEFWERLREGDAIFSEPSAFDLDQFWAPTREDTDAFYVREAGYIQDFVPDPASITEPDGNVGHPGWPRATRWLRHCAVQALSSVHQRPTDRWLAVTTGIHDQTGLGTQGVVLGDEYRRLTREALRSHEDGDWLAELADHAISAHYDGDGGEPQAYLPASVSRNALRGVVPAETQHLTLDAACASGLFALDAAIKALREGACDVALVGGTAVIEPIGFTLFCRAQGISMSGNVRPFDRSADGTLIGEGSVVLALKSYARAVADGDRVLGVVQGTGLAADGRGKSVHAPATRGQKLAIARAWTDAGVEADDLDWVVAHGTGTPVGDEIELRSLLSLLGPREKACQLTSNKQVFGHTGVLAGLVSVAHVLVALQREAVPGQPVVTDPHPLLGDGTRLTVPVRDVPWPTDSTRPRVVGVSSFGLGGADAHVVLSDRLPAVDASERQGGAVPTDPDDLVVVGWNAHLPGLDPAQVPAWFRGEGPLPEVDFGTPYPLPSPRKVRIPPLTMRHMDAAHLMMLQVLGPLLDQLGEPGTSLRPTTALIVGATLPTTHNTRAALRVHARECSTAFDILPDPDRAQTLKEHLANGLAEARGVIPGDLNEDDFTGAVSCILSGRAANYFDFQGLGTSVYSHRDSTHTAIDLALRQLRHRACDLALVGAVCLQPISGWSRHLAGLVPDGRTIADGAAVLAITRRSVARKHDLPVLGVLSTSVDKIDHRPTSPAHSLPALASSGRTYLSLDALLAVVNAMVSGTDTVVTPSAPGSPLIQFISSTGQDHHSSAQQEAEQESARATRTEPAQAVPGADRSEHSDDLTGRRQTFRLVPTTPPRGDSDAPAIPPGSIVITDNAEFAAAISGSEVAIWSPRPGIKGTVHVPPEGASVALTDLPFIPRHIRVLSRLPVPSDGIEDVEATRMESLQDLTFTTVQAALPGLRAGGSISAVLLGAIPDDLPPPLSGLFTGLVRSIRAEVPQCVGLTLLSDAPDAATGLDQLARGGTIDVSTHTLACRRDEWFALAVADDGAATSPGGVVSLPTDAVVVAFGGSRGITPEILDAVARATGRPHVYVIGRTPLSETDDVLPPQAEFIAAERRRRPGASVGTLRVEYERAEGSLQVRRTVQRLGALCGAERVHHRVCDVLDAESTSAVLREILDRHGRIDLLVNAVLDLRSRALHAKSLTDFRAVRATKATGYRNLKRALAGREPRLWCNFSTLATLAPAPGDVDYCAVNEYLAYASAWAQQHGPDGHHEFSILWSGWREVGVASNDTMQETLKHNRMDAYISTKLGCEQFLSAVARPPANGVAFFVRDEERHLLAQRGINTYGSPAKRSLRAPDAPPLAPPDPTLTTPLLDGVLLRGTSWGVFTKTWDPRTLPEQDGRWMRHHRVNGEYMLPGTFTLEAAAAAATTLCPDLVATGFRSLVCRASITVKLAGPPRTVTVEARITSRKHDRAEVAVQITANRIGKNGKVLRFNDLLCETTVVLADHFPALTGPPDHSSYAPEPGFEMPVYSPDPPISLTGPFAGTSDYARGPDGSSARFSLDHVSWTPALAGMTVPAILLDAMAHLLLLPPHEEAPPPVGPMAGIDHVDLAGPGNDCRLSAENPTIRLHCEFDTGVLTAVTGEGRALARISGVSAHALDHSGQLVRPRGGTPQPTHQ